MSAARTYRIGQIVPSSNTTMETEIPAMLRAREAVEPERFTFHSSRMRMKKVTREELAAMDADSDRCAAELSDARADVIGYACLVAIIDADIRVDVPNQHTVYSAVASLEIVEITIDRVLARDRIVEITILDHHLGVNEIAL